MTPYMVLEETIRVLDQTIATMDGLNHDANLRVLDLLEQNDALSNRIHLDLDPRIKRMQGKIDTLYASETESNAVIRRQGEALLKQHAIIDAIEEALR